MYSPSESAEGAAFGPMPASPRGAPMAEPLWRRSDATGLAIDFNPAWLQFTERSAQSSVRNGWLQDVHPEDRARCLAIHGEMQHQRLPYTLDFRLRHTQRGHCWLMERATPLLAPDGRFDGFAHHCTDIQDRMALEEELAERSRRMRCAMRTQALFASALGAELDRHSADQLRAALGAMARLAAQAPAVRRTETPAGAWLHGIDQAVARGAPDEPHGVEVGAGVEESTLWIDAALLGPALACAIGCAATLRAGASRAEAAWRVTRCGTTLTLELPALPGSSGFVLLDLALRLHGCTLAPLTADGTRWRVALPLV